MSKPLCQHCQRRVVNRPSRGLCHTCYSYEDIRSLYGSNRNLEADVCNMTEEELDRLIAEQRRRLPAWWHGEVRP